MVTHKTVQLLGGLFWLCGATSTSVMIVHNLFIYPLTAKDKPISHLYFSFVALCCGVMSFLIFYGPVVFIPLAHKETKRIQALQDPKPFHFFHKYRLLALMTFIPIAVVVNKKTSQYFIADMLFGALVTPVSLGLWSGGLFVMLRNWWNYTALEKTETSTLSDKLVVDDHHLLLVVDSNVNDSPGRAISTTEDIQSEDIQSRELGICGPVVGHYSIENDSKLYDLNNHYSKPRLFWGFLIRSPIECAINYVAFLVLLAMQLYVVQAGPSLKVGHVDWLLTSFKLSHFFFHGCIHLLPNYSIEKGMHHLKCHRVICGIVFGVSRYMVFLIIAWRYENIAVFVGLIVTFVIFTPMKFLGEQMKTLIATVVLGYVMCSNHCNQNCLLTMVGGVLNVGAGWCFYFRGRCFGWEYKEWRRDNDRAWVPYHVVSDVGNAIWIIAANYNPESGGTTAFDMVGGNTTFSNCW